MDEGEPEALDEQDKHTGIAEYGIRPIIHIRLYTFIRARRRLQEGWISLKTKKYGLGTYPVARLRSPATFHYPPYVVHEPHPLFSLRSLWTFSLQDLPDNDEVRILDKRYLATEDFIYHHPQRIAIRCLCRAALLQTELVWDEELWTRPLNRGSSYAGCDGWFVRG